jgi:hypothetical protein
MFSGRLFGRLANAFKTLAERSSQFYVGAPIKSPQLASRSLHKRIAEQQFGRLDDDPDDH